MINEKLYKASDVIEIISEELSDADFYRVLKRLADTPMGIVRCKECRYLELFPNGEKNGYVGFCTYGYSDVNDTYANYYCPYGERKEPS